MTLMPKRRNSQLSLNLSDDGGNDVPQSQSRNPSFLTWGEAFRREQTAPTPHKPQAKKVKVITEEQPMFPFTLYPEDWPVIAEEQIEKSLACRWPREAEVEHAELLTKRAPVPVKLREITTKPLAPRTNTGIYIRDNTDRKCSNSPPKRAKLSPARLFALKFLAQCAEHTAVELEDMEGFSIYIRQVRLAKGLKLDVIASEYGMPIRLLIDIESSLLSKNDLYHSIPTLAMALGEPAEVLYRILDNGLSPLSSKGKDEISRKDDVDPLEYVEQLWDASEVQEED